MTVMVVSDPGLIVTRCEHGRRETHPVWEPWQVVREEWSEIGVDQEWVRCDREDPACDLEVVRPGKVQCSGECGRSYEPTMCVARST